MIRNTILYDISRLAYILLNQRVYMYIYTFIFVHSYILYIYAFVYMIILEYISYSIGWRVRWHVYSL